MRFLATGLLFLLTSGLSVYGQGVQVATTEPLSAEEQKKKFHLPPGFEIQLVVDESHIGQPMNLNFDAKGRLWISHSVEYPYPVAGEHVQEREERFGKPSTHAPQDRVTIVEGINDNGVPTDVWDYATGLNIPIGLTPTGDGALIYSIPNIERYSGGLTPSTNSQASNSKLLGPFGNVDTHGMTNSFIRAMDGWVYATHGFRNTTTIQEIGNPKKNDSLTLNSGNTYRFREDGSEIEQFTWGQVNPFGLTFDEWGNLYSADCHSKPLTMLLRGAYYSSFGKPHDGLGFGPDMIDHSHGSTGICGPAYYAANHFPAEYRNNMFLCNPVTGRVHRDKLRDVGSTRLVEFQPDFITCDDPWFRPVDLKLGPDGALYLADFYNAIIGHYEVPLEHPSRDRTHGRIWRIVYRGNEPHEPIGTSAGLEESPEDFIDHANLLVRQLAINTVVDQHNNSHSQLQILREEPMKPVGLVSALWIYHRCGLLNNFLVESAIEHDSPLVRTHLARILAETPTWNSLHQEVALTLLQDSNPFVQRAAADAIGLHPQASFVDVLWKTLIESDPADTHLRHTLRIALKSHFLVPEILNQFDVAESVQVESTELTRLLLAVPSPASAAHFANIDLPQNAQRSAVIQHMILHGDTSVIESLVARSQTESQGNLAEQCRQLLLIANDSTATDPTQLPIMREWAIRCVTKSFATQSESIAWTEDRQPKAWTTQQRPCSDGTTARFFSSLPLGEQGTGVLRSASFELPEQLTFYIAGHCGFPDQPCHGKNRIVLRDSNTRQILAETKPPRHDTARKITWDLKAHQGRSGYIELIDGDSAGAYAWFAIGRFSSPALNPSENNNAHSVLEILSAFRLKEVAPQLMSMMNDDSLSLKHRLEAASGWNVLNPDARLQVLIQIAQRPSSQQSYQEKILTLLRDSIDKQVDEALAEAVNLLSSSEQRPVVDSLLKSKQGGEVLVALMEHGKLSPLHLREIQIQESLVAAHGEAMKSRVEALLANLPQVDQAQQQKIETLAHSFSSETASAQKGFNIFKKHCSVCHKIGNEGNIVGPQLDGIGQRGVERLLQDLLTPNQNVDGAFRVSTLALTDGRVLTGLSRRTEGTRRVFVDNKGKEFTVDANEVDQEKLSSLSLMPTNLTDSIPGSELHDLLAYLLSQRAK